MTRGKQKVAAKPVKMTMADYAMSFEQLGHWLAKRMKAPRRRAPEAMSLSMVDGAVTAVVVGPLSELPDKWVCPLLGVNPDAFNHDTETFSAIAAVLMRHNAIGDLLSTEPENFEPLFPRDAEGQIDPGPWCMGFYSVVKPRLSAWSRLLKAGPVKQRMLTPILFYCVDGAGHPVLDARLQASITSSQGREPWRDIARQVEAMRQFWMPIRFPR